jgi:hypothetical protein
MIKYLNDNAGAAQTLLSGLIVIATTVYVLLTRRMWVEMRESNRRASEPVLYAGFESGRVFFAIYDFVLRNDGPVDAFDVTVRLSRTDLDPQEKLDKLRIFSNGLPALPPRQEFRTIAFDLRTVVATGKHLEPLVVTVNYKDIYGRRYQREYNIDLATLAQQSQLAGHDVDSVGREIKDMQDDTRAIRDELRQLREGLDYAVASLPRRFDRPGHVLNALSVFRRVWDDHCRGTHDVHWVGFVPYRVRLLCRMTYDALAETDEPSYSSMRPTLLKMSELRFYLDGGASLSEFQRLGNEICAAITALEHGKSPEELNKQLETCPEPDSALSDK